MIAIAFTAVLKASIDRIHRFFYKASTPEADGEMRRLEHMLELERQHELEPPAEAGPDILDHVHQSSHAAPNLDDAEYTARQYWWHAAGDASNAVSDRIREGATGSEASLEHTGD